MALINAAKDVPMVEVLKAIFIIVDIGVTGTTANTWNLYPYLDRVLEQDVPKKIYKAKLRSLLKQGLVDGCACGCRGGYTLTIKGHEQLFVLLS